MTRLRWDSVRGRHYEDVRAPERVPETRTRVDPAISESALGLKIRESLDKRYRMPNIKGDRPPEFE